MSTKKLFINTMGCQMNVYDSGQIERRLAPFGFTTTDVPEEADLIIVNTCAIRAKAEQKAFSFLGRLAPLKQQNPELIIGVGGCVAQQEGQHILSRMPQVDLVFGTQAIRRLPQTIQRIASSRCRVVDVEMETTLSADDFSTSAPNAPGVSEFVTIMRGCDNYCTYCVVPHVRGRESSRPPDEILFEIEAMVANGVREVTLLGQNVNSYGQKEGLCRFDQLLEMVNEVEGLERIRFTTSHPKDLSRELMVAFGSLEKLAPHIHLPVQSGSDRVLKRMNRRYTRERYVENIRQLRDVLPEIAITSDIIVGFPGETKQDFEATLELIREVEYDGLFAFIYSDRPNAPAAHFDQKITESEKKERLQAVLACQEQFTLRKNQDMVGSVRKVLVEGPGKSVSAGQGGATREDIAAGRRWSGRTGTNKIVHFVEATPTNTPNQRLTGLTVEIMIERAMPHSLWGRHLSHANGPMGKGEQTHAA